MRTARCCATTRTCSRAATRPHGLTAEGEAWLAGARARAARARRDRRAERALAAAPPARLLRERVRASGASRTARRRCASSRDRARARVGGERRAQGLGRFRQPLPHARRADLGRPRRDRRGPDPARADQRGSGLLGRGRARAPRRAAATDDDRAADRRRRGLAAGARRARRAPVRRLGRRARGRRGVGRRQDSPRRSSNATAGATKGPSR